MAKKTLTMKIALIGYGKMGHAIEKIAKQRGHEIVAVIDENNLSDFDSEAFRSADVAIEFTSPASAVENYLKCFRRGMKVVSGSTGWTAEMERVKKECAANEGTFFWTSNFSIGVNVFFALNRYLAKLMAPLAAYSPELMEIHHIHKLDHPSGTAISLAKDIESGSGRIEAWTESEKEVNESTMLIKHEREGEVPGTHIVSWESPVDSITIEHRAKSRDGFAVGAVMAAEWVADKKGFLDMTQFMNHLLKNINPI